MAKHGKNYNNAEAKLDKTKAYSPKEAMTLVKELASAKFDETVEVSIRLGVDTRKADQNVRGSISLPNGTGKEVRVAVFAEGEQARAAEAAGADIVGSDDLVAEVQAGNINFDAVIATPNLMGKVGRLGRVLGPRGLMPNPKLGTVTMDVEKMVKELKAGRVEYRADRYGICHVPMGRVSFTVEQLVENYAALYTEILRVKRKQLDKAEKRILELDKLFVRIYEDNVAGKLSDERFAVMSSSYEEEQQSLKTDAETLRQEIEVQEQQNQNLELFIQKVHQYADLDELTAYAAHDLIKAIYVGAPDKSSGKRRQSISICYDFVGFIPVNEQMKQETA